MARHRKNTFLDFSEEKKSVYLDGGHINDTTSQKIQSLEQKFIKLLEKTANEYSSNSDYSIYTGYSGISLLFFLKYRQTLNQKYLLEAIKLTDSAVKGLKNKRISFLNGDAGPLALGAVLHKFSNEEKLSNDLIARLLKVDYGNPSHPDEVLYGRAGYLYSLLFVDKYCGKVIPNDHYNKVIGSIIASGRRLAREVHAKAPLYYMWHDKNYLGAAHGVAGILYLLLLKDELLSKEERDNLVKPTLDWLVAERFPSGNPRSSEGSDRDRLVQWCHGAPGFIHLYLQAYKVYREEKYFQLAEALGEIVWERGLLEKGYSICHGVSGNAYTFLALFKATKEEKHLYRAICFADYCTNWPERQGYQPDRPMSLFEGIAGIAYFLNDINDPFNSSFPAYEI